MIIFRRGWRFATALALTLAGCGSGDAPGGHGHKVEFPVEVTVVKAQPVEYLVSAPGVIDAFEQVQVTARVPGAIDKVTFAEGATVKKGQVLVSIEQDRYQLAVDQARAQVAKAEASQLDAQESVKRRETAVSTHPGLIPGEEVEGFRTKLSTATADVRAAQESLKQAQLNLRDADVRAPMDGVVQTRTVETGQYVQPGTVMATLLRRDPLLLRFQVPAQDAPRLKPDMPVQVTLRESSRVYPAKIILVAGSADSKSHLIPVTAQIDDAEHQYWLRPGVYCDVTVPVGSARVAPVIPQMAVRASERGFIAFVVEGKVARERLLKLGMHTADGQVEVTQGLKADEILVVRGAEPLSDGVPVQSSDAAAHAGDGGAPAHHRRALDGGAP